jgi:hypothetical protein
VSSLEEGPGVKQAELRELRQSKSAVASYGTRTDDDASMAPRTSSFSDLQSLG